MSRILLESKRIKVKYEGNFSQNKRDGFGTLYDKNGKVEFSGQWSKDESLK